MLYRMLSLSACVLLSVFCLGQRIQPVGPGNPSPLTENDIMPDADAAPRGSMRASIATMALAPDLLADSLALVDLYNSTDGSHWIQSTNWLTGRLSTWFGVTVSGGRVTRLILSENNLVGTLPESIGNLNALGRLYLRQNSISGEIPQSIGNLTKMVYMTLNFNQFSGSIPSSIGNLTLLNSLYLHNNMLTGDIPSSFANLTNMEVLTINMNDLRGNLNWVGSLTKMLEFYFYGNPNLACELPASIGNLTKLTKLAGGGWVGVDQYMRTRLTGEIPTTLRNCTKLTEVYLDDSDFYGEVPDLSTLVNLKEFHLFNNPNLRGDFQRIVPGLTKLVSVWIWNTKIGGSIPASVMGSALLHLNISKSAVRSIPASLTGAVNLNTLQIDSLGLTDLPNWSASFPKLTLLTASENKLKSFPNFSMPANRANLVLSVEDNELDFGDLELHFTGIGVHPYKAFEYAAQKPVGVKLHVYWGSGTSDTLSVNTPGNHKIYQWQHRDMSGAWLDVAGQSGDRFIVNSVAAADSGLYRLRVTNEWVTGVELFSETIQVSVTDAVVPPTAKDTVICSGQSIVLSANGTGDISWYDVPSGGTPVGTGGTLEVGPLVAGTTYYVAQVVAGEASERRPVRVAVNELPVLTVSGNLTMCAGSSVSIGVSGSAESYTWSEGLGSGQSFTVSPVSTTTYIVTGTGMNGCFATALVTVTVRSLPTAAITPAAPTICEGASITLVAAGGSGYQWSTGALTRSLVVRPDLNTTYQVVVNDTYGCRGVGSVVVTVDSNCPAAPEALRAAALSTSVIRLNWQNFSVGATGFRLERKNSTGNFTAIATLPSTSVTYDDKNLQAATLYIYRIKALKGTLESLPSNEEEEYTFSNDQHYVKNTNVLVENVTNIAVVPTLPVGERIHSWSYLDGSGRPYQTVLQEYSASGRDVIQPYEYDVLGRQSKSYLPYTVDAVSPGGLRTNALGTTGEQTEFYNGVATPDGVPVEAINPYTEVAFDNSPIGRVEKVAAPGEPWKLSGTRTQKMTYRANNENEVLLWAFDGTALRANFYYDAGTLRVSTQEDTQGNKNVTYTDDYNRTVLRRTIGSSGTASTYFIYNAGGALACQVPPLVAQKGEAQTGFPKILSAAVVNELCFVNGYDDQRRLAMEKSPGAGPVYYIYNRQNRRILTQDARQRLFGQWTCSKYDRFGRLFLTGLITDVRARDVIQQQLDAETTWYEERSEATGQLEGYTNQVFPTAIDTVLSVHYFDDYSFVSSHIGQVGAAYSPGAMAGLPAAPSIRTDGKSTGTKVRILGTNTFLWSVSYYNNEALEVQTVGGNADGGIERASYVYNFTGWLTHTKSVHFEGNANKQKIIAKRYNYDHTGRPTETFHRLDEGPEVQLSKLYYNELGLVIKKDLHVRAGVGPLQSIDYEYNIRGWLTGINKAEPLPGEPTDYFREVMSYESASGTGNTPRYDGLITSAQWSDDGTLPDKAYNYTYDGFKRLSNGAYRKRADVAWTGDVDAYSENNITYDVNGNIKTLDRFAPDGAGKVDQLVYGYGLDSNKLLRVTDNSTSLADSLGFYDGNLPTNDYAYDANGNIISDLNKGIQRIHYNLLNLPSRVVFGDDSYVLYVYDATGERLSMSHYGADGILKRKVTYSSGVFEYVNDTLTMIHHDEGQILLIDGINSGNYQYNLADHLGNTRVVVDGNVDVSQSIATMESAHVINERAQFLNYSDAVRVNFPLFDHTKDGVTSYATRLNGAASERVGLVKVLSVMPGDTIRMEVFAKYLDPQKANWSQALRSVVANLSSGAAFSPTAVDVPGTMASGTATNPYAALLAKDESDGPKAYLNYIIFDRNFAMRDGGYVQLSAEAKENGSDVPHERLFKEVIAEGAGYVYVYLSNESEGQTEVYFDDFSVEQLAAPVVEVNGFYPYGMTAYSHVREGERYVQSLFQGKTYDSLTQWHDFHARQYDGALGRWLSPDPAGQFSNPYIGMGNNPVNLVDPDGRYVLVDDVIAGVIGGVINLAVNAFQGNLAGHGLWEGIGRGAAAFGAGAVGGVGAIYPQFGGWVWGGAVAGATNAWLGGASTFKDIGMGAGIGVVSSVAGGGLGQAVAPAIAGITNGIASPVVRGAIAGTIGGAVTGGALGGASSAIYGGSFWGGAWQGAWQGAATGAIAGGVSAGATAYANGFNPFTGKDLPSIRYRAINPQDMATLGLQEGMWAKNPDGTWTLEEHTLYGSRPESWENDPWISLSAKLETAIQFDQYNKSGVVRVDLNMVNSPKEVYWQYEALPNKAYWLSKFHTETSTYRHVPQSAIKSYMPHPVKLNLGY